MFVIQVYFINVFTVCIQVPTIHKLHDLNFKAVPSICT